MARALLRHTLRDTRSHHIAHGGTAEIVKEFPQQPHGCPCRVPSLTKIFDPSPLAIEYPRAVREAYIPFGLQGGQGIEHFAIEVDRATFLVLRRPWIEAYRSGTQVHAVPCQSQNLLLTPAGVVRKGHDW